MLTKDELHEIEEELHHYPTKEAASIEALKVVQKYRGWVSDDSLKAVATLLEMSPDELDGVATFYNIVLRKPVGKNVIFLCDSVSCWIMGYETVKEYLCRTLNIDLGETTADGQFTLLTIPCLGTCDHAPALMINRDLHRDLTPEKMDALLESYRQGK